MILRDTQSAGRVAGLAAAMMIGASQFAGAQVAAPVSLRQAPPRVAVSGTSSNAVVRDEAANPHQVLAMAYRDNMIAFATAMRTQASEGKSVDVDIARPAMTEMRRSYDKMTEHSEALALAADDSTKTRMAAMEHPMETHLAVIDAHLTALEMVVRSTTPSAASVADHTSAILKECEGMSAARGMKKDGMAKDGMAKDGMVMPIKPKPMSMPAKPVPAPVKPDSVPFE